MIVVEGHIIILITDLPTLASYPQRYNTYFVDFILSNAEVQDGSAVIMSVED